MSKEAEEFETSWGNITFLRFLKIFQLYFENPNEAKGGFKKEQYLWIRGNPNKMDKDEERIRSIINEVLENESLQVAHGTTIYIRIAAALEKEKFTVRQQLALFDHPDADVAHYGGDLLSDAEES